MCIFILTNSNKILIYNIDNNEPPEPLHETIDQVIDFEKVFAKENASSIHFENSKSLEELSDPGTFMVRDGESANDVNEYKNILNEILGLTGGRYNLKSFKAREENETRYLDVQINEVTTQLKLDVSSGWVDYVNLIKQLNSIIKKNSNDDYFFEIRQSNWGQEFGIVYGSEETHDKFRQAGFLRNTSDYGF